MSSKAALCVWVMFAAPVAALGADSLQSLRDEVRIAEPEAPAEHAPTAEPKPAKKREEPWLSWDDPEDEDCNSTNTGMGTALLFGAGIVVTSPYWIPHTLIEDDAAQDFYFAPAPYDGSVGSMIFQSERALEPPTSSYRWATRLRTEYLDDFDGLTAYRGHLLIESYNRLGFDTELNHWRESLRPGVEDELWTGDANFVYRFAQNERVQVRSGLGMAWLSDERDTDFGFNFTYSGDIYPIEPLVLSAELDAGWIGEAWLIHLRSTAGVVYRQVEVYAGYDYLEIGDAQVDGFIAGLRVLF